MCVFRLLCVFSLFSLISSHNEYSFSDDTFPVSIYYEVGTGIPYKMTSIRNNLSSSMASGQYLTKTVGKYRIFGYRANGCSCQGLACSCCAGFNMPQLNFNQEGCMSLGYDPNIFGITMNMQFNNNSVFENSLSARNPPPFCVPVPIPYIPGVDFCVKLFDVHVEGRNLHMCLDFQTRLQSATVLVLHFDCMRLGADGVSLVKPGQTELPTTTTTTQSPLSGLDPLAVDSDIYDPVNENKYRGSFPKLKWP
ncbi:uncharacterized protein [Onthophagus taurus]|uniref:uncharacterized protein n=1 Tax=Onthophagus taurus TaxID=166361 RepID=UPI0039BDAAB3